VVRRGEFVSVGISEDQIKSSSKSKNGNRQRKYSDDIDANHSWRSTMRQKNDQGISDYGKDATRDPSDNA
jgi:hypothetical protein